MAFGLFAKSSDDSFSPTKFRNSFNKGIGRPSLYLFRLKRYPNVYFQKSSGGLGSIAGSIGGLIGGESGANIASQAYNIGETLYSSVSGSGLQDLQFRISRFGLPDKELRTYTTKIYGPSTEFPREIENGSLNFSVLCGGNYFEHEFFQTWIDAIMSYGSQKNDPVTELAGKAINAVAGLFGATPPKSSSSNTRFNVAYYDDVISDAELIVYNEDGNPSYHITFEEVYPMVVGGIEFDWNLKNEISVFNVVLNYRLMKAEKIAASIGGIAGEAINLASNFL